MNMNIPGIRSVNPLSNRSSATIKPSVELISQATRPFNCTDESSFRYDSCWSTRTRRSKSEEGKYVSICDYTARTFTFKQHTISLSMCVLKPLHTLPMCSLYVCSYSLHAALNGRMHHLYCVRVCVWQRTKEIEIQIEGVWERERVCKIVHTHHHTHD